MISPWSHDVHRRVRIRRILIDRLPALFPDVKARLTYELRAMIVYDDELIRSCVVASMRDLNQTPAAECLPKKNKN